MTSPIFDQVHGERCFSLRVVATGGQIDVRLEPLDSSGGYKVNTLEEAEDYVLSSGSTMSCPHPDVAAFAIMVMRAANNIAGRTRRGAGNVVFMHPAYLRKITASPFASANDDKIDPVPVGRWIKEGKLNNLAVYTSPHMRMGQAVVMYIGSDTDRPAYLFGSKNDLTVKLLPSLSTALGNHSDYSITVSGPTHVSLWISR